MTRELREVWVVRDPDGELVGAGLSYYTALQEAKVVNYAPSAVCVRLETMAENERSIRHDHAGYSLSREDVAARRAAREAGDEGR